jgi:phospholipid/cholesterol/gamma-HCH transport system permease protein
MISLQKIGENTLNAAGSLTGSYKLLCDSLQNIASLTNAPVRSVLYKQIYFTGMEAFRAIALIGGLIGIVIITQVSNIVGSNAPLTGKILIWVVVRELGPLFSAIIVIARSCTAIASELGSMKVNGEIEGLRIMGIPPMNYLIVPRIAGVTISVFILSFYFQAVAILGGLFLSSIFMNIPFLQHTKTIFSILSPFEAAISLFKSLVFGLIVSSVSCYQGLKVKASITEIPQATTVAVMHSLFLVFIADGLITLLSFL